MIDKNLKIQIVNELYKHIEQPDKIEINLWQFYVIIVIIICLSIITIRYIYVIFVGIRDIIRRIKAILADDDDVINKKKKKKKKKKNNYTYSRK